MKSTTPLRNTLTAMMALSKFHSDVLADHKATCLFTFPTLSLISLNSNPLFPLP